MSNDNLDKATFWIGEPIVGYFLVTVDTVDPAVPSIDILNAGLEFIVKNKADTLPLITLTIGNGLTIVENTSILYNVVYRIPGSITSNLVAPSARENTVTLFYELNITYGGETESNVLESGTIKIRTDRVKTF